MIDMGNFFAKMCKFDTFVLYAHYASALTYFFYFTYSSKHLTSKSLFYTTFY